MIMSPEMEKSLLYVLDGVESSLIMNILGSLIQSGNLDLHDVSTVLRKHTGPVEDTLPSRKYTSNKRKPK